jgi:hypothetical protein
LVAGALRLLLLLGWLWMLLSTARPLLLLLLLRDGL